MNKNLGRRLTVLSVGLLLISLLATSVGAAMAPGPQDPEGTQLPPRTGEELRFEFLDGVTAYWVPYYKQTDPAWKDDNMETCDQTIGAAGCTLTSVAMIFDFYGSSVDNPSELNDCMGNNACPFMHDYAADNCSSGEVDHPGYRPFSYTELRAIFDDGPPVLKMTKGTKTHWVVVYSMSGDGLSASCYKVRDPARTSTTELSYLVSLGWSPNNIHKYCPR